MPPSRLCYRVWFPACLQKVGYLRCLAGLASLRDWRGSCLYSELIPSVTERSALFVKELSFPQTAPTDDTFFNRNWAGACWNHWAGPLALDVGILCKNKKQKGSAGACPLPLRCLSQFFPDEEKINCLESEFFAYLSPTGWPGIYSGGFSRLDSDKDSLLLDGGFSFLIVVRLIRDN